MEDPGDILDEELEAELDRQFLERRTRLAIGYNVARFHPVKAFSQLPLRTRLLSKTSELAMITGGQKLVTQEARA